MVLRNTILRWAPRALAAAFILFISLFALDAFEGQQSFGQKALSLFMHLIPTWTCLLVVVLSWKREWLGSLLFLGLAVIYAVWAWGHLSWILAIAGPLVLLAVLYAVAWQMRKNGPAR
ncbi:MAG: hypothetical protein IPN85_09870 [Flavobacteriales bacterium]|nr:hypothetical protein [Flavobacteriales bacterium]MBK9288911.1 hypothetical protein [Flavobacteriales bacterium]